MKNSLITYNISFYEYFKSLEILLLGEVFLNIIP